MLLFTKLEQVVKDGIHYWKVPVEVGGVKVGFAPLKVRADLPELQRDISDDEIFVNAMTQRKTLARNHVAAKDTEKVTDKQMIAMLIEGKHTERAAKMVEDGKAQNLEAAYRRILHESKAKPNPETIYWDEAM